MLKSDSQIFVARTQRTRSSLARAVSGWMVETLETRRLCAGTPPVVPAPAVQWSFEEGAGTVAADSSGNGHTGTLGSGATWVTGNVGTHAVALNGTTNGVVTATGPAVNTAGSFTASAWVDLASLAGYQTVLSIAGNNVAGFFLGLRADTGTFAFSRLATDATGTATVVAAPAAPSTNTWYHLVGVDDAAAGTMTLYVDGQSVGSTPFTSSWAANGNTLIGNGCYGGQRVDFVNGSVDEVAMFSSALSAAQVAALDQPAAYPFDEGAGTTAADFSGHGNPLTLAAGASWGAGRIGSNALAVNGTATGNAINAAPVINTALPFSVSAWVKLTAVTGFQTFVSIDGATTSGFYLQLRGDTGKFAFSRLASDSISAAATHADATAAPTAGVWYNLVGVNNVATGQLQLYVNGILQSTVAYSGGWQATGATVVGGGKFNSTRSDFTNGSIDDVRFFNSPLNASHAASIGTGGVSTININAASTGVTVSPNLFGAFMEDINYGGEGGIYNDEVRNSGFNDSTNPLNSWTAVAAGGVTAALSSDATTGPTTGLTKSGKLVISSGVSSTARAGISNSGYFGVAVAPSTAYTVSFYAKATAGFTGPLTVDLESTAGTVYGTVTIPSVTTGWKQYTATLTTSASTPVTSSNLFVISTNSSSANGATIWFGATYLYPPSYQNAANHLRIDLMQKLLAMKPGIFRVPGGNYLEGNTYNDRFEWSNTIGPVANRPGHFNSAWGYWSTDGMGLDEYLQMAEEINSTPILAVYAGFTLTGTSDTGATLSNDVTDAVNELHYVLDPVSTSWGALRAANGHPAPYNIPYVEIGNEDFFSSTYGSRYPLFYNAIHAAFPALQTIATSTSTGGSPYDVLDEHYYNSPQWFEANSNMYDNRPRGSTKVFIGEYASNQGSPTNNMNSALGDASWLLGLERNSDLVTMSSYAPLWANVNGYQWPTNLIGFNGTSSYGSPSYYAQVMLSQNHGTTVVSESTIGANGLQSLVTRTGSTYYLTVVNTIATANAAAINIAGLTGVPSTGTLITLSATSASAVNSIANPTAVAPVTTTATGLGSNFTQTFPGYSVTILKFSTGVTPTVASPATATPSTVNAKTTSLSVLGTDAGGEANLTYTWSSTGPAPVTFDVNGTNASKHAVATFSAAGDYTFTVTITNAGGQSVTSQVAVKVNQTLTLTSPALDTVVGAGSTTQFAALDQFGNPGASVVWSATGGGTVSSTGLFTAGSAAGSFTVKAVGTNSTATLSGTIIPVNYTGGVGADTYAIRIDPANSQLEQIFINTPETSAPTYSIALSQLSTLTFAPTGGDGSLTVDFANGNPLPAGGVSYTGGANPTATGNRLHLTGVSAGGLKFSVGGSQVLAADTPTSPISFGSLQKVQFDLLGGGNVLTQTSQPSTTVAYNAGPGANTLNVNGGTFTFGADPQTASGQLTVNDNSALVFTASAGGIAVRHLAALNVNNGATAIFSAAANHNNRLLLVSNALSIGSTGRMDLGGNDADVVGGNVNAVQTLISQGFNAGSWTGNGIRSSLAASTTTHLTALGTLLNNNGSGVGIYGSGAALGTFDGINPAVNDVLIKYTYFGDANLDGQVDGSDYTKIDAGFGHATGWLNGDFNYDLKVDGSDYTLIDNSFNTQGVSLAASIAGTAGSVGTPKGSAIAVPTKLIAVKTSFATVFGSRPIAGQGDLPSEPTRQNKTLALSAENHPRLSQFSRVLVAGKKHSDHGTIEWALSRPVPAFE